MTTDDIEEKTTLEGVLLPVRWDASGTVVEVALMTFDEDEYRVDAEAARRHGFISQLRKHVRIRGSRRGQRLVRVTELEILDALAAERTTSDRATNG